MLNRLVILSFTVFTLLVGVTSKAQDSLSDPPFRSRVGVHLNMNFSYVNDNRSTYKPTSGLTTLTIDNKTAFEITPALRMITKRGDAMEFALDELAAEIRKNGTIEIYDSISGQTVISEQEITSFAIGPRFEFDYVFLKTNNSALKPFIGLSAKLFFKYTGNKPAPTYLFDTSSSSFGTTAWIVPGAVVHLNDKGYFAISFPIDLGTFAIKTNKTDNPALPEKTRKTTTYDYDYWAGFRARFTFGLYFR